MQSKITELRSEMSKLSSDTPDTGQLQQVEQLSEKVMHGIKVTMEAYPSFALLSCSIT